MARARFRVRSRVLGLHIGNGRGTEVLNLASDDNVYPNNSNFHFLAFTYNQTPANGNGVIYVDTVSKATGNKTAETPSTANSDYTLHIGARGDETSSATATFGEVGLYDRLLTTWEMDYIYNQNRGSP